MKILFLIRSLDYGGAERQLVVLSKGLKKNGHTVSVAVFFHGGKLEEELLTAGIPVHYLEKKGRWDIVQFMFRLKRLVFQEKPDILHSYLPTANILTVIFKPCNPKTSVIWGVRASFMDLDQYDRLTRFSYWMEARLANYADGIIANSNAGKDLATTKGFPQNKIFVIPNGIDTDIFYPNKSVGENCRLEWGIKEDYKVVGLVGRIDPMKDYPTFFKAAQIINQQRNDVSFVCVGDGLAEYKQSILRLCKEMQIEHSIIWAGIRSDMCNVYNAFDVYVNSSYGEGFANTIAEAMACGIPCVVTNVGDSSIIVGDTGMVVRPRSPAELAQGILSLLETSRYKEKDIRRHIITNFSIERLVKTTIHLMENIFSLNTIR